MFEVKAVFITLDGRVIVEHNHTFFHQSTVNVYITGHSTCLDRFDDGVQLKITVKEV